MDWLVTRRRARRVSYYRLQKGNVCEWSKVDDIRKRMRIVQFGGEGWTGDGGELFSDTTLGGSVE